MTGKVNFVLDILTSPAGVATSNLLLRHLPSSVTVQMLGSQFCLYGKLRVSLALTQRHGFVGILQFSQVASAQRAAATMSGAIFQIQVLAEDGQMDYEQFEVPELVYACAPLQSVRIGEAKLTLMSRNKQPQGEGGQPGGI
jgi:hypothetical protein